MSDPRVINVIECSRAILQLTEEMLILLRDDCAAIAAGTKTVTAADARRLHDMCCTAIAQMQTARANTDRWLGLEPPAPARVM